MQAIINAFKNKNYSCLQQQNINCEFPLWSAATKPFPSELFPFTLYVGQPNVWVISLCTIVILVLNFCRGLPPSPFTFWLATPPTVYCIPSKLGTEMGLYIPFCVPNFKVNGKINFVVTFGCKWIKKNEKTKPDEIKSIFEGLYFGNAWHNLVETWDVCYWNNLVL